MAAVEPNQQPKNLQNQQPQVEASQPLKRGRGRPKGTTGPQKVGLSLVRRLRILSKIALDKNATNSDRIKAVQETTSLLNDSIRENVDGIQEVVMSFGEYKIETKPARIENPEKKLEENIVKKLTDEQSNKEIASNSNVSPLIFTAQIDDEPE